jgi:TolA-binding protein
MLFRLTISLFAPFMAILCMVSDAFADLPARLRRIDVKPQASYTRLVFNFDKETPFAISELSGQRLRLRFDGADSPLLSRLRGYADRNLGGVIVRSRGDGVMVDISLRSGTGGYRVLDGFGQLLTVDIGPSFRKDFSRPSIKPGREAVWNGAGRFVKEYDAPLKSDLPFFPSDSQSLRAYLSEDDVKLFMQGEGLLYKGRAAESMQVFEYFLKSDSRIYPLAAYRCGEAHYLLQNYKQALKMFQEGERVWPQFLAASPATSFSYADCMVREGDLPAGRRLLGALIVSQVEKKSAPILLVRLADILARQQHEQEAVLIYRNVVEYFPDNKAASYAALKLADRRFTAADELNYGSLRDDYRTIAIAASDFIVREEAFFKATLLDALNGTGMEGLESVTGFEKRYGKGAFAVIARSIHEEMMPVVYRELVAAEDREGLVAIVEKNVPYLQKCMLEPSFIADLDKAYIDLGLLKGENKLFGRLVRAPWSEPHAPFMYNRIIDNAFAVADWQIAENAGREFVQRFPRDAGVPRVWELLGDIDYRKGDLALVRQDISWLLNPKSRAVFPESYYYLGKALEHERQAKPAEQSMNLFIGAVKESGKPSALLADAYFTIGMLQSAAGKPAAGLGMLRVGLSQAAADGRDRFLYRIGELSLKEGRVDEAKSSWEKIVKEGTDAVWQKLASQAIADLEWKQRIGGQI